MATGLDASTSPCGRRAAWLAAAGLALALVAACGGGSSVPAAPPPAAPPNPTPPTTPPPATPSLETVRISGPSPFAPGCSVAAPNATVYANAEVEASAAVNPVNPTNLVAAWQQDRWSDGGAQGLVGAASFDGGRTWTSSAPPFSVCAGATGTPYQRATDPWLTFAADGTAYFMALAFTGSSFGANSSNAMLVARSTDGGRTWGSPTTLIADAGGTHFNDKNAIAADATDARYVYAAWDRLARTGGGPAYFTRTTDGGLTWEPARAIYDPGTSSQTIGTLPVSLPDGTLLIVFTQLDEAAGGTTTATLRVLRSADRGATWSVPVTIAASESIGTRDPATGQPVRDGSDLASAAVDRAGIVHVAWQDARPNGGARDAIVASRSTDGGRTWSAPVRVSGGGAAAFMPNVQVRADGMIGVGYYDLRNDTPDPATLQTDYWLATSTDGLSWTDTHVAGPFSLTTAPVATSALFVGDYQALLAAGSRFLPVFVQTTGDVGNRTDVYAAFGGN